MSDNIQEPNTQTMNKKQGNKMIAEFMGLYRFNDKSYPFRKPNSDVSYREPQYHSSWDWLMPACKKFCIDIADKMFELEPSVYDKYIEYCESIETIDYDVSNQFKILVEAIQWYNTTLTSKK